MKTGQAFRKFANSFSRSPGRISMAGYALVIAAGTFLLLLPISTVSQDLHLIDALFTASSAVCVTGLTVVDTPLTFTFFGKTVILLLIQIGGIGIMVVSTVFLFSIGKKISLTGRLLIRDTYSYGEGSGVLLLVKDILVFTFMIEATGALILFFRFYPHQDAGSAAFNAVFHAVSAFCNAGFSLFSNSFINFQKDWIVNLDICALIILGGIGFIVLSEIRHHFFFSRQSWSRFSLHTRLVISSTLVLLVFSTAIVFFLEWSNTLENMTLPGQVLASFFQAVNARTAGFNTLPIGELTNGTLFFIIVLMFIGTAPGSCGGGVKITTVSSIFILGVSRLFGREHPHIFFRRISDASIAKAVSLIMISLFVIGVGTILLLQTEIGDISHQSSRGLFLEMMFETVSAFGTVGLSTGVTPGLSAAGKLIITLMMYIGRLGPLAIAIAVSRQGTAQHYSYAQENIMIG